MPAQTTTSHRAAPLVRSELIGGGAIGGGSAAFGLLLGGVLTGTSAQTEAPGTLPEVQPLGAV